MATTELSSNFREPNLTLDEKTAKDQRIKLFIHNIHVNMGRNENYNKSKTKIISVRI